MKNPLTRRVPRELKRDAGKYIALFIFITLIIGFVSGFLVSDDSLRKTYDESFEKYNVEDGHFIVEKKLKEDGVREIEKEGVTLHELFFKDEEFDNGNGIRIYERRNEVNREGLWEGKLPEKADELAIDRLYAANNGIETGDTVRIGGKDYRISGMLALSDYSSLFQTNAQFMFDANHFCVAVATEEGFDQVSKRGMKYCYAWTNEDADLTEKEVKRLADDVKDALLDVAYPKPAESEVFREMTETGKTAEEVVEGRMNPVEDFVRRKDNQAISFTGEDMGQDKVMILTILYLVIIVLAFTFGITAKSTIEKEAGEVGTLRASGYRRGELLFHYTLVPMIVTVLAAAFGNALGYTLIKSYIDTVYYHSYSLMKAGTYFNSEALLLTTCLPVAIVFLITVAVIYKELRRQPLSFLRGEAGTPGKVRAYGMKRGSFLTRFRKRVFSDNVPAYFVMACGILLATILLMFCLGLLPLLNHFKGEVIDSQLAKYQYVMKTKTETKYDGAEKYQVISLKTDSNAKDEITVYGIVPDSKYLKGIDLEKNAGHVLVSSAFADKFGTDKEDIIELHKEFGDGRYRFEADGVYEYAAALAVFMDIDTFNKTFDKKEGDYAGYFSDRKLKDLPRDDVAAVITQDDFTIVADQLNSSMAGIFVLFMLFGVMIFAIVMYLLTKQIVDRNVKSISMTKILGYQDREIASVYNRNTLIVVIAVLILSVFIANCAFEALYRFAMSFYAGWMTFYIDPMLYVQIGAIGIISYAAVHLLQLRHIRKIKMGEALKGME